MKKFTILVFSFCLIILLCAMPAFDGIGPENADLYKSKGIDAPNQRTKGSKTTGTWHALVILIDFPDYRWNNQSDVYFTNDSLYFDSAHYNAMLSSIGTYKHPESVSTFTGSMRDFYLENSYGAFDVISTTTVWYTAPDTFNYYCNSDGIAGTSDDYGWGSYPNNVKKLVEDALAAADASVDFSLYDNDLDGTVDALFVVHAGPGAEGLPTPTRSNYIWSHAWGITSQSRDGVTISGYSMENQDGKVGVFCHEFGHVLGLPDFYDTDYSSEGIGDWGCMSGGSWGRKDINDPSGSSPVHFTAPSKWVLEWLTPTIPQHNLTGLSLPPIENYPAAYMLWTEGISGHEYFMIENRQNIGFDSSLVTRQVHNNWQRASGLVIYHVDEAVFSNSDESHRLLDVEEGSPYICGSDTIEHLDYPRNYPAYLYLYNGNRGDNGDTWPGYSGVSADSMQFINRNKVDFNHYTCPSSASYALAHTLVGVENINQLDTLVTFDVFVTIEAELTSPPENDTISPFSSYALIWESSAAGGIKSDSVFYNSGLDAVWHLIDVISDSTTCQWNVPDISSDSARIRIVSLNQSDMDNTYTSYYFAINSGSGISHNEYSESTYNMKSVYLSSYNLIQDIKENELTLYDITGREIKDNPLVGKYWIKDTQDKFIKSIILLK